jgi:gluconokinase
MASTSYEAPFVLAVDVGSSSVRATLFDARAQPVAGAAAREDYRLRLDREGMAEADARCLLERVDRCIDGALGGADKLAGQIAAVAVDTLAGNLLGIDRQGRAITPIYAYSDSRSRAAVPALRQDLDEASVYQRTGCPLHTAYTPARLLWLRNSSPEVFRRVHRWLDLGSFLFRSWMDDPEVPMSYSLASWWGLLDRHRLKWDEELLE